MLFWFGSYATLRFMISMICIISATDFQSFAFTHSLAVFCDGSSHIPPPLFPLSVALSFSLSLSASLSLCLYFYCSPYLSLSLFLSLSLTQCITSPFCIHLPIYLTSGLPDEAVELSELRLLSLKNNRIASLQGAFFLSWVKVIMELSFFISCFLSSD